LSARRLFEVRGDEVRAAGVNESLAQLYIAKEDYQNARIAIGAAVETLELNDSEAVLAEALTTKGLVAAKLNQSAEAIKILEGAKKVAERCGFSEGVARIFLIICEDLSDEISESERQDLTEWLDRFSINNGSSALCPRIKKLLIHRF
jgi:hypothetical protein